MPACTCVGWKEYSVDCTIVLQFGIVFSSLKFFPRHSYQLLADEQNKTTAYPYLLKFGLAPNIPAEMLSMSAGLSEVDDS